MDFSLTEEERQTRDWVRTFVQREIMPMEPEVLRRERAHQPGITADELAELRNKARKFGFWGSPDARRSTAGWTCPRCWPR